MKTSWTKGLKPEQKEEMIGHFQASAILRGRLQELITEKVTLSREASMTKDAYNNPNWAYLQADARGYERALSEIFSLLSK